MKQPLIYLLFVSLFAFVSCVEEKFTENKVEAHQEFDIFNLGDVAPGVISVKLQENADIDEVINQFSPEFGAVSYRRTFPDGGRFETRRRSAGLHLWYQISFNPDIHVTKASSTLSHLKGIQYVEYVKEYKTKSYTFPFDDPRFAQQWSFYNDGSRNGYIPGCDINVIPAWEINTGSKDVIVAVFDEGVQFDHEDLAANMWRNEAELNGTQGVDDDGNGFVDDFYGYNFTTAGGHHMIGGIIPGNHGSNVAGIIAAVNNNGVGVAGIAGGDGSGNGVRIMSCQMIENNTPAFVAEAFVYATDNGAVIANNSWGHGSGADDTKMDRSMREAIDYFIENAGMDENGNQEGPMAGGLVIFAAGNDHSAVGYPAKYEKVIAVASIGADYKRSSFSNYGADIDISAPGGDNSGNHSNIHNAFANNSYSGMAGTSQACPHVSGVAALIVSQFGGPGFTNEMLKDRVLKSTKSIDEYNPTLVGLMGSGIIDAYMALRDSTSTPPEKVNELFATTESNKITLSWLVTKDDSGKALGYYLYYSTATLKGLDIKDTLPANVVKVNIPTGSLNVGDTLSFTTPELEFNTMYYFRIDAYDNTNNHSGLSEEVKQETKENHIPVIKPLNGTSLELKYHEEKKLEFELFDEDGHTIFCELTGDSKAATITTNENKAIVTISGRFAPAGDYKVYLTAHDPYSSSDSLEISYKIAENHAPVVIKQFDNLVLSSKADIATYDLTQYFKDEDGEPLTYRVISSAASTVVNSTIEGNTLTITGNWLGNTALTVTAADLEGKSASASFEVLMRDGTQEIDLYPNPTTNYLYIRTSETQSAKVVITTLNGGVIFNEIVPIDPFDPAKIDVTTFAPGSYKMVVEMSGKTISRNFVKL